MAAAGGLTSGRAAAGGSDRVVLRAGGPRILFCLSGTVRADDGHGEVTLPAGGAAFGPAGRAVTLAGDGVAFQATTAES